MVGLEYPRSCVYLVWSLVILGRKVCYYISMETGNSFDCGSQVNIVLKKIPLFFKPTKTPDFKQYWFWFAKMENWWCEIVINMKQWLVHYMSSWKDKLFLFLKSDAESKEQVSLEDIQILNVHISPAIGRNREPEYNYIVWLNSSV